MTGNKRYDMSKVAPHMRQKVLRRIELVEAYISGTMSSADAIAELGMSVPTFWRAVRTWRTAKRPEDIGGSGRVSKPRRTVSDTAKAVIEEAERQLPTSSMVKVSQRAVQLGAERQVPMPSSNMITAYAGACRRSRGLRPEGVTDLVLEFCTVNIPAIHQDFGPTMPNMCILLDVRSTPVVLGMTLAFEVRSAAHAARTILDAIARADSLRSEPIRHFQLPDVNDTYWLPLERALIDLGLPVKREPVRPRASARNLTKLIGKRPAHIELLPDFTARPPQERGHKVALGDPVGLIAAEEMLRGRLLELFSGPREALSNSADGRGTLSIELQRIISPF